MVSFPESGNNKAALKHGYRKAPPGWTKGRMPEEEAGAGPSQWRL